MNKIKAHTIYKINCKHVPGVTTIIGGQLGWNKAALIKWSGLQGLKGNDPSKVRDNAAEIGTLAHSLIHDHISFKLNKDRPKKPTVNLTEYSSSVLDNAEIAFNGFLEWEVKTKPIYKASEVQVLNRYYKYGGTVDLIAEIPTGETTELAIVDFKTSSGFYPEMMVQLAAYASAYEIENEPATLDKYIILQIDKTTGSFHEHILSKKAISKGWTVFKHLLALYNLQKEFK
jgi:hypothetical protein